MTSYFEKAKRFLEETTKQEISEYGVDEGSEYGASHFKLGTLQVRFRVSKITPTKIGQFVTVWKRDESGVTAPFDEKDGVDLLVICAACEEKIGLFIIPKDVALKRGVFSSELKGGKRGMRVYPPWDIAVNKQAMGTQKWQMDYFFDMPDPVTHKNSKKLTSIF